MCECVTLAQRNMVNVVIPVAFLPDGMRTFTSASDGVLHSWRCTINDPKKAFWRAASIQSVAVLSGSEYGCIIATAKATDREETWSVSGDVLKFQWDSGEPDTIMTVPTTSYGRHGIAGSGIHQKSLDSSFSDPEDEDIKAKRTRQHTNPMNLGSSFGLEKNSFARLRLAHGNGDTKKQNRSGAYRKHKKTSLRTLWCHRQMIRSLMIRNHRFVSSTSTITVLNFKKQVIWISMSMDEEPV